jgi:hypothetical protein
MRAHNALASLNAKDVPMVATNYRKLLTSNTKLAKVPDCAQRYAVRGLALAPHNLSGRNVCPRAGACREACVLWFAGRTNSNVYRQAALNRTARFFDNRALFLEQLSEELASLVVFAAAHDAVPAVRLNAASDIKWETVAPDIFADFPSVKFYDYTKFPATRRDALPDNYFLTHSVSEKTRFADIVGAWERKRNLAIVFDSTYKPSVGRFGALPGFVRFWGPGGEQICLSVVDGDKHDVRLPERDGASVVVGLRGKGGAARVDLARRAGFVKHYVNGGREFDAMVRDGHTASISLT